jgi:catechol 2,3-dioxygenase-like lactoylglutathione lyase family enzyme
MEVVTSRLVPLAYVASVEASIAFYERLGFQVSNRFVSEEDPWLLWAALVRGRAALMLARATAPVVPEAQAVLFYLYFDDIAATREALLAQGLHVGPLLHRAYCPEGECRLVDPDGYVLMLTHT